MTDQDQPTEPSAARRLIGIASGTWVVPSLVSSVSAINGEPSLKLPPTVVVRMGDQSLEWTITDIEDAVKFADRIAGVINDAI